MRALALLSGVALLATVLVACDGGATEPPFLVEVTPMPTATEAPEPTPTSVPEAPTPPPETGGLDGFRAFAALSEGALAEDDASLFADRGLEGELTCAGDEQVGPCLDQPAGTILSGFRHNLYATECGCIVSLDEYAADLTEWFSGADAALSDEYGSGALVLYALAHRPAGGGQEEAYLAVVTAMGIFEPGPPTAARQVRVFAFQFLDGSWRLADDLLVHVGSPADWLEGDCSQCYDQWERREGAP